jgi:hypothetical protein
MISPDGKPQYIVDEKGNRTAVILDLPFYRQLLEAMEELEEIREYDAAKAEGGEEIPLEQALKEIEDARE